MAKSPNKLLRKQTITEPIGDLSYTEKGLLPTVFPKEMTHSTHFFIRNAFFNSASVLHNFFMNWASNIA